MTKSKDPELEIKAKLTGTDKWKDLGNKKGKNKNKNKDSSNSGGALYFVGFLGALVYNLQAAIGFGAFVTGFLKSMIWPAYIVYKLLENFYGVIS